jgi:hypothetical protein
VESDDTISPHASLQSQPTLTVKIFPKKEPSLQPFSNSRDHNNMKGKETF